jgi:general nucleoside transport system ATP-binding protein
VIEPEIKTERSNEIVLQIRGLTKRFGSLIANENISLHLQRSEVVALLGENGAGKSTLVSQLFGHYRPDAGSIEVFGKPLTPGRPDLALAAGIGMVHQHFTLAENLSVLDNVLVGTESLFKLRSSRTAARERLNELGRQFGLGINPSALIADLSVGERQRVEILKALYRGAKILILDEPTAVLTPQEAEALFSTLRQLIDQGLSLIFISHKLDEVLRVADRVLVLRQGKLVAERNARDSMRSELAQLMVGREVVAAKKSAVSPSVSQTSPLLSLNAIRLSSDGRSDGRSDGPRSAKSNETAQIDLKVLPGEIVAIAGVAGNGQQALAHLLMDRTLTELKGKGLAGTIEIDPQLRSEQIARITADRQGRGVVKDALLWENAIIEDLYEPRFVRRGLLQIAEAKQHANAIVKQFDVRTESIETRTAKLSGGNMQKLILGRNLVRQPKLIIADQPTWGLDVGAVAFVHQQLLDAAAAGTGIILISEDLDEVFALADRIGVIFKHSMAQPKAANLWNISTLGLAMAGSHEGATACT